MGREVEVDDEDDDGKVFPDEDYIPLRTHQPSDRTTSVQTSQIRTVLISVVATLTVLAVGWFGWQKYSAHGTAEETKQLTSWVQQSMREKLSSDPQYSPYGLQVTSVDLIKVSDNKYEGMASVTTFKDRVNPRQVSITVTSDGDRMMWQAAPGAFMFLAQDALANYSTP